MAVIEHMQWQGDARTGHLRLLDQTKLPTETAWLDCRTVQDVWDAIKRLSVRGAPAIGIAAAYGCVIGSQNAQGDSQQAVQEALKAAGDHLATSRPTAVNLFWAIGRMQQVSPCTPDALLAEAKQIHDEDRAMCHAIGQHTLKLIERYRSAEGPTGLLTHCNAGSLATGGIGTATAGIYLAHSQGVALAVYADETRPLLQGSRLTAYELGQAGIDVTLICDDMAGQVMREGRIDMVITGADRIASNGDAANKIGTYSVAVLAKHHGIPFVVAAPSSTFDMSLEKGSDIPIEQRAAAEITNGFGRQTAPDGVKTYSPAFDVTPNELITAIVTEKGLIEPVSASDVRRVIDG